jgi:hypothetical protein
MSRASWIVTLIALGHLVAVLIATASLWWFGNWERYSSGLVLTLRIIWGVWIIHALSAILTRVTIFGWNFRTYFRLDGSGPRPAMAIRPAKAPWYKSGAVSFSITVVLVSLTGACAIATTVMYMLIDTTGDWVFWLVFKIVWSSWWVLCIATVLTRLAIFGTQKKKATQEIPERVPLEAESNPEPSLAARDSSEAIHEGEHFRGRRPGR